MKNGTLLSAVVVASLSTAALAEAPSYNYVGASFEGVNADGLTLRGYGLEGSAAIGSSLFVAASYLDLNDKVGGVKVEGSQWTLGGGYRFYEQGDTSAYAAANYLRAKVRVQGFGSDKADGYDLGLGVRHNLMSNIEVNGSLVYSDLDSDRSLTWNVGGVWFAMPQVGITLNLSTSEGDYGFGLGARYQF